MNLQAEVWMVLALALVAANMPFLTTRLLGVLPRASKSMGLRLLELLVLYFVVGGVALWLENAAGAIYPQGWEFYAVTWFVFVTLAFPGFVYRYLWRHH
jgi:hypothetical protein